MFEKKKFFEDPHRFPALSDATERHTWTHMKDISAAHQRAPMENSKGVTQVLADTRHTVLHGSNPSGGLVAV